MMHPEWVEYDLLTVLAGGAIAVASIFVPSSWAGGMIQWWVLYFGIFLMVAPVISRIGTGYRT